VSEGRFGLIQLPQDEACGRQVDARPGDLRERLTAGRRGRQVVQCAPSRLLRFLAAAEVEPCSSRACFSASAAEGKFTADLFAQRVATVLGIILILACLADDLGGS
jgi:hypothetical protein